ncbi:hydroxymethylglutaryl-CoA lyase [Alkalihalobacterium elongatum]|uniref:hydroxymethylglutaryl-CoA lyase n=1 Tax=Alkalihalobacterium elongatum TaxID=2675466 RepID=UPI001C1F4C41|nr:hydroxymethylglutaryl-CoA lyase [Alkalihalobacterium elongatum]
MAFPKKVKIREVGPREGMQIEKASIATEDKIRLVDLLSECNFPVIEVTSFVSPKWVPEMADAELVAAGFKRHPGTEYQCVYLNSKGIERAQATGKFDLEGVISITASETFSRKNTNRSIEETFEEMDRRISVLEHYNVPISTLTVMTAFGCNYEGDSDLKHVVKLIDRAIKKANDNGIDPEYILLGDTVGWANPVSVENLVGQVQDRWPNKKINLHLHDTRGMGLVNAFVGLKMGVDYFDTSVGGLGGCPFGGFKGAAGNIATEDMVHMCHELGIETGIDLERLLEVTREAEKILGRELPGKVSKGKTLSSYRRNFNI